MGLRLLLRLLPLLVVLVLLLQLQLQLLRVLSIQRSEGFLGRGLLTLLPRLELLGDKT